MSAVFLVLFFRVQVPGGNFVSSSCVTFFLFISVSTLVYLNPNETFTAR